MSTVIWVNEFGMKDFMNERMSKLKVIVPFYLPHYSHRFSGIWVRIGEETIPAGTLFGPLRGVLKEISVTPENTDVTAAAEEIRLCLENRHFWNLGTTADGVATFLDVSDEQKSNWMRFVKKWVQSDSGEDSNLTAILHERKIYFVASQPLRPGEELCFWYAN